MTVGLYLEDSYLRRFDGTVIGHGDGGVLLDRTVFYPSGGGQPTDRGELRDDTGQRWTVEAVEKSPGGILHRISGGGLPAVGTTLHGEIDWDLRYRHMRYHTALHLLSGVVYHRFGSGITGGQIYADRARTDFSLPEFSRDLASTLLDELNRKARESIPVHVRWIPRSALLADPSLVRVAKELLPDVDPVRLIEIGEFDVQADGGTHVRSTSELGSARLEKLENKGARNKRLYLSLDESGSSGAGRA
ncbi:MAG TPA: alanyl-tRNA editing protein [Thermoplasmata archaeon]|nr:alanyl-tRNA editing protein [Thermoplasmata archaeon]